MIIRVSRIDDSNYNTCDEVDEERAVNREELQREISNIATVPAKNLSYVFSLIQLNMITLRVCNGNILIVHLLDFL